MDARIVMAHPMEPGISSASVPWPPPRSEARPGLSASLERLWLRGLGLAGLAAVVVLLGIYQPLRALLESVRAAQGSSTLLELLCMVPVGATLIVFLRLVVGVESFGIFVPLLLGMAFSRVGLVTGLLTVALLVLIVTPLRLLLERVALLSMARTGVLVGLCALGLLVLIASRPTGVLLSPSHGVPVVIMAGLVDRFATAQMEQSLGDALKLSLGTLASSTVVSLLFSHRQWLLGSHPDLMLLSFPILLLLGRYTGLRLLERLRYGSLLRHGP